MDTAYLDALATAGASLITHLGLVDDQGVELAGGDYARLAVTWTTPDDGLIRPTADLTFEVPAGATVAGWSGFSASTAGTRYGGAPLTREDYAGAGQYVLEAASTGITHVTQTAA